MKKFFEEFKAFAMRGNVLDMAVGVVIGGAFGKITTSLVNDIIMPLISMLTGGIDFSAWKWVLKEAVMEGKEVIDPEIAVNYGNLIAVILDFIIIAFAVFCMVKAINKMHDKLSKPAEPEPAPEPTPVPTFDGLSVQPAFFYDAGEQQSYTVIPDNNLNMRAGPGTDYDKVSKVPASTVVTALGANEDGSWVVVNYDGKYAWLKAEFLS